MAASGLYILEGGQTKFVLSNQPSNVGSQSDKAGTKLTSTKTKRAITKNGKDALKDPPMVVLPSLVPTKRETPTGGVMHPI